MEDKRASSIRSFEGLNKTQHREWQDSPLRHTEVYGVSGDNANRAHQAEMKCLVPSAPPRLIP